MFNFLKQLVSADLQQLIGYPRIRASQPKPRHRKKNAKRLKLKRRMAAQAREAEALKMFSGGFYPPKRGSRRPEFSSAIPGRWSTLNGLSAAEQAARHVFHSRHGLND